MNISSKRNMSPHTLAVYLVSVLLLLYLVSPLEFTYFTGSAYLVVLSSVIFIAFSYIFTLSFTAQKVTPVQNRSLEFTKRVKRSFHLCLLFSIVGVTIRFLDFLVFRGFDFSEGLLSLRLSLQSLTYAESSELSQAGLVSALGAILYGFTLPLTIVLISFYSDIPIFQRRVSLILASTPVIDSVLSAGIMGAVFTLLYITFAVIFRWEIVGRKLNVKRAAIIVAIFIFALASGAWLFIGRVELMFGDFQTYAMNNSGLIKPSPFLYDLISMPVVGALAFSYYWLASYLLQGVSEFSFLVDNFNTDNFFYGAKQLFVVDKFLSFLGITDFSAYELVLANPRAGRYQTVFGDIYMDFGVVGLLLQSILTAALFSYAYIARVQGRFWGVVIYPFFQASIVAAPLINVLSGARIYGLVACIVVFFFYYISVGPKRSGW